MLIAQELRRKNIAEYSYMWQVEDTIRAFGCSLGRIRRAYIDRFDYTDEQKEDEADWFGNLIRMMNEEGCREKGHLQINKVVLQQLEELHVQLLGGSKFPFYNSEYYKVLPYIVELRNHGANKEENEVETCFNSLYGSDDASFAEEGNLLGDTACSEGNIYVYRYAERLLFKRINRNP